MKKITPLNSKFVQNFRKSPDRHFVIQSSYYYKNSKLYSPNTMIVLLNAHKQTSIDDNFDIKCFSKNASDTMTSKMQLRMGNTPSPDCSWEFFIANCTTVTNPDYFGLAINKNIAEINFELPVKEKYPVVMCYPPMVYESRWQQIIFATEIYHYFGTDLQIQYINSAIKEIVDILDIYEKKKWIKTEKFAFFDFNVSTINSIGVNPMLELKFRNLPLAFTDCLMKYRESAEFIITADVDDVLFPTEASYFKEFSMWKNMHPNAASFMYHRSFAKLIASNNFSNFSIANAIETLHIGSDFFVGKTIHLTNKVETAWVHWPGLDNTSTVSIPPEKGRMFHVQIHDAKIRKVKNVYELRENEQDNLSKFKHFTPISRKDIKTIESAFISSFKNISNFHSNFIYTEMLFRCFSNTANTHLKLPCFTPLSCEIPKIVKNFKCVTMKRDFSTKILNKNVFLYIPRSNYYIENNKNGCKILSKKY